MPLAEEWRTLCLLSVPMPLVELMVELGVGQTSRYCGLIELSLRTIAKPDSEHGNRTTGDGSAWHYSGQCQSQQQRDRTEPNVHA